MTASDNAHQPDDIGVTELSHNARFRQEIKSILLRRSGLERLYRNYDVLVACDSHATLAHVAELTWTKTRSSAFAERPRDACKNRPVCDSECQLL